MEASSAFKNEAEATNVILNKTYALKEFCSPESFESYDDLKNDLIKFCKKYTPKKLSQDEFEKIVSDVFGVELGSSYTPKVAKTETQEVKETKKAKTEAPKKEPVSVNEDDIDDLLNDLDI